MSSPNWVLARSRCTAAHYFGEIEKVIRRDVDRFNRLEAVKERQSGFVVVSYPRGDTIEVHPAKMHDYGNGRHEWVKESGAVADFVSVICSGTTISATRADVWRIDLKLEWNVETLACDMILNGEVRTLDYISQQIIGEFMFEGLCP